MWTQLMPAEFISDLWEVRACFQNHYGHRPRFIITEDEGQIVGFLPLSWNDENKQYNYFPGETWESKTWLEQNRIIANSSDILKAMLASLDEPYYLRYLRNDGYWCGSDDRIDELGYLFLPENYDFDISRYYQAFSHKTAKRLKKELSEWNRYRVEWRFDRPDDFDILCQMNRARFGRLSYFHDERFLESFRSLLWLLHERGWLRLVTVIIDGEPAAVDMGSLYNRMLTMLAGGTNEKYRGIAKLINMHHITYACEQKLDSVDFLCGDFNWKTLFHLTPTPLYMLEGQPQKVSKPVDRASISRLQSSYSQIMQEAPHV